MTKLRPRRRLSASNVLVHVLSTRVLQCFRYHPEAHMRHNSYVTTIPLLPVNHAAPVLAVYARNDFHRHEAAQAVADVGLQVVLEAGEEGQGGGVDALFGVVERRMV